MYAWTKNKELKVEKINGNLTILLQYLNIPLP